MGTSMMTRVHNNRQAGRHGARAGLRVYILLFSMGQRELLETAKAFEPSDPTQCDTVPPIFVQTTNLLTTSTEPLTADKVLTEKSMLGGNLR